MKNKYYTPLIEEFCVGFEYEMLDPVKKDYKKEFYGKKDQTGALIEYSKTLKGSDGEEWSIPDLTKYRVIDLGWDTRVFSEGDSFPLPQWIYDGHLIEKRLYGYRVKYLDQKDLENLGFDIIVYNDTEIYAKYMDYIIENFGSPSDKAIRIYRDTDIGVIVYFTGIIKNKSELKKLLKQLGILY